MRSYLYLILFALLIVGARYAGGPPPAHTGGFGEPTCHHCHFDNEQNAGPGELLLQGIEQEYKAGAWHELKVFLTSEEMSRAGFQVSARYASGPQAGMQAGQIEGLDERVVIDELNQVQYLRQTDVGSHPAFPDTSRWYFKWLAPADTVAVVFHITANAANGDNSEFGDHIYSTSRHLSSKD